MAHRLTCTAQERLSLRWTGSEVVATLSAHAAEVLHTMGFWGRLGQQVMLWLSVRTAERDERRSVGQARPNPCSHTALTDVLQSRYMRLASATERGTK